jgi:dTDP-glucose 4,6-dehydratase
MRHLVTGAAGFVGHHAVEHILETTDDEVVGVVSFRHRGDSMRLAHLVAHPRLRIIYHDLAGPISGRLSQRIGPVDSIIHFAAESHVDRSISDPVPFVRNNVDVTLNVLEYARTVEPRVVVQISTDEVYGPALGSHSHGEWEPIIPSNPYSASKACQEAIAISYWRTYGVPVVLSNTMNNFGPRQDQEKFVPNLMRHLWHDEVFPARSPEWDQGSRFWMHARNHADAILFLVKHCPPTRSTGGNRPDRWNVVGDREMGNQALAQMVADLMGRPLRYEIVSRSEVHRPGHDLRYGLDGTKLARAGWRPPMDFEDSLRDLVSWTQEHPEWLGSPSPKAGAPAMVWQ